MRWNRRHRSKDNQSFFVISIFDSSCPKICSSEIPHDGQPLLVPPFPARLPSLLPSLLSPPLSDSLQRGNNFHEVLDFAISKICAIFPITVHAASRNFALPFSHVPFLPLEIVTSILSFTSSSQSSGSSVRKYVLRCFQSFFSQCLFFQLYLQHNTNSCIHR